MAPSLFTGVPAKQRFVGLRSDDETGMLLSPAAKQPRVIRRNAVVGLSGLEPPTSRLSGVRSNRLSYKPIEIFRSLWCFQLSLDN